jgi:hypothetical protein
VFHFLGDPSSNFCHLGAEINEVYIMAKKKVPATKADQHRHVLEARDKNLVNEIILDVERVFWATSAEGEVSTTINVKLSPAQTPAQFFNWDVVVYQKQGNVVVEAETTVSNDVSVR